ncbi:sugar ABC transporter substrate-binding protein [Bacterioplanes sanyensis]|uniref:Sugar ABC transporter substrate-binding protein n=1 Tax=Bacterioplanes sanyensis TaxID=1249553 RepID=A0A222FMB9_9GAMM|nr:SLBB domain-containing protein [Bacterioplanes sanyensis]ASP39664.1 sugar ABC transporter substrate-binding protein [Bacterioplanes sanyensis]
MKPLLALLTYAALVLTSAQAAAYIIQVGDQIRVTLPGESSLNAPLQVDRQGRINIPEVGSVSVAGLSEEALADTVTTAMSSVYRDLSHLKVYVSQQQMLINIQGYVKEPGEYTLPASASVQVALHAAGGLRSGAQLDRLQLKRDGNSRNFDYKAFLDSGDFSRLPTLRSLDTLFIPASPMIGNVETEFDPAKLADGGDAAEDRKAIKVFGEVNRPGSFSYKPSMSLVDLLMRAGGVTRYAGVEQIRVISNSEPELFNLKRYLDSGNESLLPVINAGATIFVPRQEEEIKSGANTVYIMGEVAEPGAYEGKKGATFMDILANAGGPTRFAESRQIRILKASGEVIRFDLSGYTEGTLAQRPPKIEPGDAIFVPEKTDMNEKSWLKVAPDRAVRVLGEVVRPGRIEWSNEMSLLDLLAHVGGPTSRADTSNIEVVSPQDDGKTRTHVFDLDRFIKRGGHDSELPLIRAGATVRVHDLPQDPSDNKSQWVRQSSQRSIYVFGQVGAPGRYRFTNDMHFLDILSAADGPTGNADIHNIRITHRNGKHARVSKLNLALYFETGDPNLLPEVRTGDTIFVPEKNRIWLDQPKETTVRVLGAVNKPGRYRFNDNMTLLDLLAEAGGTGSNAYTEKITVVNLSCCRDQARTFNLSEFSRTANFASLPVIRAGDTIFVPNKADSTAEQVRVGISDIFQSVALLALLGII